MGREDSTHGEGLGSEVMPQCGIVGAPPGASRTLSPDLTTPHGRTLVLKTSERPDRPDHAFRTFRVYQEDDL